MEANEADSAVRHAVRCCELTDLPRLCVQLLVQDDDGILLNQLQ